MPIISFWTCTATSRESGKSLRCWTSSCSLHVSSSFCCLATNTFMDRCHGPKILLTVALGHAWCKCCLLSLEEYVGIWGKWHRPRKSLNPCHSAYKSGELSNIDPPYLRAIFQNKFATKMPLTYMKIWSTHCHSITIFSKYEMAPLWREVVICKLPPSLPHLWDLCGYGCTYKLLCC